MQGEFNFQTASPNYKPQTTNHKPERAICKTNGKGTALRKEMKEISGRKRKFKICYTITKIIFEIAKHLLPGDETNALLAKFLHSILTEQDHHLYKKEEHWQHRALRNIQDQTLNHMRPTYANGLFGG